MYTHPDDECFSILKNAAAKEESCKERKETRKNAMQKKIERAGDMEGSNKTGKKKKELNSSIKLA